MIREILKEKINGALKKISSEKKIELPAGAIELTMPKEEKFGDFSTGLAMVLAKTFGLPPLKIAEAIVENISKEDLIEEIKIEKPGFINFYLKPEAFWLILKTVLEEKNKFGKPKEIPKEKICLEFVSVNPTGPMHIAHGRWAAVGDTLANILEFSNYDLTREYYVNDCGTQIDLLGESLEARYLEILDQPAQFPEDGYHGEYLKELARNIAKTDGDKYLKLSSQERCNLFKERACKKMLADIKEIMEKANVKFNIYFNEKSLHEKGEVEKTFQNLVAKNLAYQKDGAWWFKSSQFGDEKDRVIKKENGQTTYFLSDIAYHINKINRGFTKLINIWGADHHSHVNRMQGAIQSLGYPKKTLIVLVGQLVSLIKNQEQVRMSKRAGNIITFKELLEEVGKDAVRFFFLTRSINSHMDFDIDLAKKRSNENPVYYIQYAHARICNIFQEALKEKIKADEIKADFIKHLKEKDEISLIKKLGEFPYLIKECADSLSPHHLTHYLHQLASLFHSFYNAHRVLQQPENITYARLLLINGCKVVISTGLKLLGIDAPERM